MNKLTLEPGVISEATLKDEHLLEAFAQAFRRAGDKKGTRRMKAGLRLWRWMRKGFVDETDCYMLSSWLINEYAFDRLNNMAPDGYYFGALKGDGACFGVFKAHELSEV